MPCPTGGAHMKLLLLHYRLMLQGAARVHKCALLVWVSYWGILAIMKPCPGALFRGTTHAERLRRT